MELYYDFDCEPCSRERWVELFSLDERIVDQTAIGHDYVVSTVWLGLDHAFSGGPPLIFETMVFDTTGNGKLGEEKDIQRYSTWEQAETGHNAMVEKWTAIEGDPDA